jgi:site-specific recombinase XerD
MSNELILKQNSAVSTELLNLIDRANLYAESASAENTKKAYALDWRCFHTWCLSKGLVALPCLPATVGLYLTDKAKELKVSSLERRLVAIRKMHKLNGHALNLEPMMPIWKGIKRSHSVKQDCKKPLYTHDIREICKLLPNSLIGTRDRAILLLGFAAGMRRSEIVALNREDLTMSMDGLIIHIRKSKTDQEAEGREVGVAFGSNPLTCPVRAMEKWCRESAIKEGALFPSINFQGKMGKRLSAEGVAIIVKRSLSNYFVVQGFSPEEADEKVKEYAGHSLRAGFATTAAMMGVPEHAIMRQTGHKKSDTLKKYIRMGTLFEQNASGKLGL